MINATLPAFLKHKTIKELVRIGKANHGGFVISQKDIENSDLLISLGVTEDWSFESHFIAIKKIPVIAYGTAVSNNYLLSQLVKSLIRFDRPKLAWYWLRTYYRYKKFFSGDNTHLEQHIGAKFNENYSTLQEVFDRVKSNNIFLKIDIEGNEYRIFEELIRNQHRISGLVLELHDCDLHMERIHNFIDQFSLAVIHIHANNFAPLSTINRIPLVLDITFSAVPNPNIDYKYPSPLDMPNNPNAEEIMLNFSN
jgi:hypothetical protein